MMGSFAPRGHAQLDPQHPRAFGICDTCGFMYNHSDLKWGVQWHGRELRRTGFLQCPTCWDKPNPSLRALTSGLPADPVPLLNPRAETPAPASTGPDFFPPKIP